MGTILDFKSWKRLNEEATDSSSKGIGLKVIGMIMAASGGLGTKEQKIEDALDLLRNKEDYAEALNVAKTHPNVAKFFGKKVGEFPYFQTIADMIQTEFVRMKSGTKDFTGDKTWLIKYEKMLTRFSPNERFPVDATHMEG